MLVLLPDSLLLSVFSYLPPEDISRVGRCCTRLRRVSKDNILWKRVFHTYFNILPNSREPVGSDTWRDEFIRLVSKIPFVEAEVITKHTDQVLHVSFSHDGQRFATCSKDAKVHLWKSTHPVELEYSHNMQIFDWKYTQYSQFNSSDTLLLVSGVLLGLHSTSGEIAVFSLKGGGFSLQCRVPSKPYDIFGTWYSDNFLLSGDLHWLGNLVSKSVIWLNKASQEIHSEYAAITNKLFQFYNPKASSIRSIMIANCVEDNTSFQVDGVQQSQSEEGQNVQNNPGTSMMVRKGNPLANPAEKDLIQTCSNGLKCTLSGSFQNWRPLDNVADIGYSLEYHRSRDQLNLNLSGSSQSCSSKNTRKQTFDSKSNQSEHEEKRPKITCDTPMETNDKLEGQEYLKADCTIKSKESDSVILDSRDKWLIFTCGSQTYSPHQVGFKRIKPVNFQSRINVGLTIKERRDELRRRRMMEEAGEEVEVEDYTNYAKVANLFDHSDVVLDLHGHIIGMALSPDHRYLYVNSRPWPTGYSISDPLEPPPIAQEIDIHVIDLATLKQVGMMGRAHRAYTPNEECFFIFLDAADLYLASGSEDKHCYLWDRQYGVSLAKLAHTDVVNAVAFNPKDSRMLVSVSDDQTIKIWRSKDQCRELNIDASSLNQGTKLYHKSNRMTSNSE